MRYIPLNNDKHRKVRDSSKKHTGNPRQIQSKTKCSPRQNSVQEFFPDSQKNFVFQTEFCLRLYLSWTEFCLGLHTSVVFRMQSFNFPVSENIKIYFQTPLMKAVYIKQDDLRVHVVRLLLNKKCKVNTQDQWGQTALMIAAFEKER